MTPKNHEASPGNASAARSRQVHFLLLPNVNLLDLAGPAQVFDVAAKFGAPYTLDYCAETTHVASAQGLSLGPVKSLQAVDASDLVVIPGPRLKKASPEGPLVSPPVLAWLREAHARGTHLASVCSGAVALGEAGLLDGRRCTTHWNLIEPMRQRYPKAKVQDDVLYTHDDHITTSAGIASGIDMALSVLEREHGPLLTAKVARYLVVYLRRDSSHSQTSVYLDYRTHLHPRVHRVQDYLVERFTSKVTLPKLASVARLSERGLTKAFKTHTGLTPLEYQQQLRLELATQLMHDPRLTLESIAERCGFDDARQLRRLWSARYGKSPSAARHMTGA
jgi:transcriptional regulator GlxA family with amidase domain